MPGGKALDGIDTGAIASVAFSYLVYVPAVVVSLRAFYRRRREFRFRHPPLVYAMNALALVTIMVERPYTMMARVWLVGDIPVWTTHLAYAAPISAFCMIFAIEAYLLYFQQQFTMAVANLTWQKQLNPNTSNWYVEQASRWGSGHWLLVRLLTAHEAWFLTVVLTSNYFLGETVLTGIINSSGVTVPVVWALWNAHKASGIVDVYGVRTEILIMSAWIVVSLTVYTGVFVPFQLILPRTEDNARTEWMAYSWTASSFLAVLAVLSTALPVLSVGKTETLTMHMEHLRDAQSRTGSVSGAPELSISMAGTRKKLLDTLASQQGFMGFMQHLVIEFSTENLLFLTEYTQIRQAHEEKETAEALAEPTQEPQLLHEEKKGKRRKPFYQRLALPPELPVSAILVAESEYLGQMQAVYDKYLAPGAPLPLNVPHYVQERAKTVFGSGAEPEETAMAELLDDVARSVFMLMRDSWGRFRTE